MSTLLQEFERDQRLGQSGVFANLLRMRDSEVGAHGERQKLMAREVGQRMDLAESDVRTIEAAAHLQNLGLIAIPDPILRKPGALTIEERLTLQGHARHGFEALEHTEQFGPIAHIVLHHHERYDGKGYPDGLDGETIPFASRVISVLDAYDAMTSDRPYRSTRNPREAAEELIIGKGTQFDPAIVDAVLEALHFAVH
jgi:response regulator RpfG family c-di-GMP phosphodiesterase